MIALFPRPLDLIHFWSHHLFLNINFFCISGPLNFSAEIYKAACCILHRVRSHTNTHCAHMADQLKQSISLMFQTAMPTNTRINILSGQLTATTDHWGKKRRKKREKEKPHTVECACLRLCVVAFD